MPFELSNATGVFTQLMSIVQEGMEDFAMAYLDDIMVFSKTPEEHFGHLQKVFKSVEKARIEVKIA